MRRLLQALLPALIVAGFVWAQALPPSGTGGGGGSTTNIYAVSDFVNVLTFSQDAGRNDTVNDAPAIQAALDYADDAGLAVYIPAGEYRVCEPLQLRENTFVFGDGDTSVLRNGSNTCSSAGPLIFMSGDYSSLSSHGCPDVWGHDAGLYTGSTYSSVWWGCQRWVNLSQSGAFNWLPDAGQFTAEAWMRSDVAAGVGYQERIFSSYGRKAPTTAESSTVGNAVTFGATSDTRMYPICTLTTENGSFTLGNFVGACGFDAGEAVHIACSWKGSGFPGDGGAYVFLNGNLCDWKFCSQVDGGATDSHTSGAVCGHIKQDHWEEVTLGTQLQDDLDATLLANSVKGLVDGVRIAHRQTYTPSSPPKRQVDSPGFCYDDSSCYTMLQGSSSFSSSAFFDFEDDREEFVKFKCHGEASAQWNCYEPIQGGANQQGDSVHIRDLHLRSDTAMGQGIHQYLSLYGLVENVKFTGFHTGLYVNNNSYKSAYRDLTFISPYWSAIAISSSGVTRFSNIRVVGSIFPLKFGVGSGVFDHVSLSLSTTSRIPLTIRDAAATSDYSFTSLFIEDEAGGYDVGDNMAGCAWLANAGTVSFRDTDCNLASTAHANVPAAFKIDQGINYNFNGGWYSMRNLDGGVGVLESTGLGPGNDAGLVFNIVGKPYFPVIVNGFQRRPGGGLLNHLAPDTRAYNITVEPSRRGTVTVSSGEGTATQSLAIVDQNSNPLDTFYQVTAVPQTATCPPARVLDADKRTHQFTITTDWDAGTACTYDWTLTGR